MRIFLDECCPPALAEALRGDGHDVVHAMEGAQGHSDAHQALSAFVDRRIVATADYDFGDMAFRDTVQFFGLILLAPELGNLRAEASVVSTRITAIGSDAEGFVTIVGRDRVRPRRLNEPR